MANNLPTQAEKFHYRPAICCLSCPALNAAGAKDGICARLKMSVSIFNTCDKHPDWKKVFHGKGGNQ